jgi:hypothetical protein
MITATPIPNPLYVPEFQPWPKMARLSRECVVTEKLDGTNAQVLITEDGNLFAGSRTRWILPGKTTDNYGFAAWAEDNKAELLKLGPGRHFGEWYGCGIQRNYGLTERRFALFNTVRWADNRKHCCLTYGTEQNQVPACCSVVPTLYRGEFDTRAIQDCIDGLTRAGSAAVPGFMQPEGIIVFHIAAGIGFKKTILDDAKPKGLA